MKLFAKLFIITLAILTTATAVSGYLLIETGFDYSIKDQKKSTLDNLRMTKIFLLMTTMHTDGDDEADLLANAAPLAEGAGSICIYTDKDKKVYDGFPADASPFMREPADYAASGQDTVYIKKRGEAYYLYAIGSFTATRDSYVVAQASDISGIFRQRQDQMKLYVFAYIIVVCVAGALLLITSLLLALPLKKLRDTAARLAAGDYSARVTLRNRDETGELAHNFNSMADSLQEKINELSLAAEQKDAFIANFAHELKTPLTSVIGYADMLYQRELDRPTTRIAAGYILSEGMRLESLSLKLMDLIVLDKQDFLMEDIEAKNFLHDVCATMLPPMKEKGVTLYLSANRAKIRIEYDLLKTVIINLIDNAAKADAKKITLTGRSEKTRYIITVRDNGRGIPKEELSRITEAFYMVDKSRSRKQHGAGLGLALSQRIARLHKAELIFDSDVGVGTAVQLILPREPRANASAAHSPGENTGADAGTEAKLE